MSKIRDVREWWNRKNKELEDTSEILNETTEELDYLLYQNNRSQKIKPVYSFRRWKTQKILNFLKSSNITEFLFYTFNDNIMRILEYGIFPWGSWATDGSEHAPYPISYLEHENTLDLELSNSSRAYLWEWISKKNINPSKIAIISVNINELFATTVNNWQFNSLTKRITIDEPIPASAINWVLLKNYDRITQAKSYITRNRLPIRLYYGDEGSIEDETSPLK